MRFEKMAFTKARFGTKRRIMHSFKMSEISGVDDPAQEGAKVILAKRATSDEDAALEFTKATFSSIMQEKKIEEKANRAFWEAFEDQWQANDAFKAVLCDAYSDSEAALTEYVDNFVSMARDAMARIQEIRTGDNLGKSLYFTASAEAACALISDQGENSMFKTLAELQAAIAKFARNGGDADTVKAIRKSAIDLDQVALLEGDLAMTRAPADESETKKALTKAQRDIAILKMSGETSAYFDGLDADAQDAFLAKSAEDQASDVAAANAKDPVLYKSADGTTYRESDGVGLAKMAERLDKAEGRIAKAESERDDATFKKQATSEFAYLPEETTVEMLKAADKMSDEDKKKKMMDGLRAMNNQAKKAHKAIGSSTGFTGEEGNEEDPSEKLDSLAKAHAKANNVPMHKAYDAVLCTEEGAALYAESVGAQPAVSASE